MIKIKSARDNHFDRARGGDTGHSPSLEEAYSVVTITRLGLSPRPLHIRRLTHTPRTSVIMYSDHTGVLFDWLSATNKTKMKMLEGLA
eukprot:scaffold31410_cov72-Skeletonema_dohrnii-CCMP3373.AAC.3